MMENSDKFVEELQELLTKYGAFIKTELDDRGIIFNVNGDLSLYMFTTFLEPNSNLRYEKCGYINPC